MISAKIVADSLNQQGDRLTTMLITFPRIILAELNTHRMLSKNSASSRAIPFSNLAESVLSNGFTPIAWQMDHKGMQGTNYITDPGLVELCNTDWNMAKIKAIKDAKLLHSNGVIKQICNRRLEPFMMHTVLISGTEWENFFKLRCPQYVITGYPEGRSFEALEPSMSTFRSRKDAIKSYPNDCPSLDNNLEWLKLNEGQAEIHMMALAEAMWDAMNESTPIKLKPGEWHIPFVEKMDSKLEDIAKCADAPYGKVLTRLKVKISTAMAARTSYTTIGNEKEFGLHKQIELHDRMVNQVPFHASPFEHCAKAMTEEEYHSYIKGKRVMNGTVSMFLDGSTGWCRNFKGFVQYRELIENKIDV